MKITALAGKRKSGKTTCAEMIVSIAKDSFGIDVKLLSFGTTLKEMYSRAYGTPIKDLNDPFEKERTRAHMMAYADWLRAQDPNILITPLWEKAAHGEFIVIDDVRSIEELASVMSRGGIPFKMEVDNFIRQNDRGAKFDPAIDLHYLETELGDLSSDTFRALGGGFIFNNKSRDDLRRELPFYIKQVFVPKTVKVA